MNCCDSYGKCTKGPGCPVRESCAQEDATVQFWAKQPAPRAPWYRRLPLYRACIAAGALIGFVIGAYRFFANP
jgi:hypothetical protein